MNSTVSAVVTELSAFLEEIQSKPALMKSNDATFILDRVKDLCRLRSLAKLNLLNLPREIML
jgi:hypothetical protein